MLVLLVARAYFKNRICSAQNVQYNSIVTVQLYPTTGHKFSEGVWSCSSILSLNSGLDVDGLSTPRPGRFTTGKTVQFGGWGWLGLRAGLDGAKN